MRDDRARCSASETDFALPSFNKFIFVGKMIVQRGSLMASLGSTQTESTDSDPLPSGFPGSLNPENTIPWDDSVDQDIKKLNTEVEALLEETK